MIRHVVIVSCQITNLELASLAADMPRLPLPVLGLRFAITRCLDYVPREPLLDVVVLAHYSRMLEDFYSVPLARARRDCPTF